MDRRNSRILVGMVFGFFFERSIRKIENGNDASQPELSLEGAVPSNVPRADVERYIVEFPLLCFVDQSGPFVKWERIGA